MLCQGLCDPMESRHHRLRTWLHIQHPTRLEGPRYANRDSSMPNAACMASACGAALDGRSPLGVIQYVSVRQLSWGRCIPGWPRSILWYRIHRVTLPNLCFFFFLIQIIILSGSLQLLALKNLFTSHYVHIYSAILNANQSCSPKCLTVGFHRN